jgi:tetratricopeptide (TPR) repeat protein
MERRACVADALGGGKAEALERARRFHDAAARGAAGDDLGEALWRTTLGEMLIHNLRYEEAERELRASVATLGRIGPEERPELLDARVLLGRVLRREGHVEDAEAELQRLQADCERLLGAEHFTTLLVLNELCEVRVVQRRWEEARALYERLIASFERRFGPDSESALGMVSGLADVVGALGDPERAEELARRAAEGTRRLHGAQHPLSETRWGRWGLALIALKRTDEGLARLEEALQARSARLGPEDPDTLEVQVSLGNSLYRAKRFERCHAVLQAAYDAYLRRLGPDHPATLSCQNSLAGSLFGLGRFEEAAAVFRGIFDVRSQRLGRLDPDLLVSLTNLAAATSRARRTEEACCLFGDLLARSLAVHGPDRPQAWAMAEMHAGTLLEAQRGAEALDVTTGALAALRAAPKTPPERLCTLLILRGRAAQAAGAPEVARAAYEDAFELATRRMPEASGDRADAERAYGGFLVASGDAAGGAALLETALARLGGESAAPRALVAELCAACERAGLAARAAELRAGAPHGAQTAR